MPSHPRGREAPLPPGYGGIERFEARIGRLLTFGGEVDEIGRTREGRPLLAYRWGSPRPSDLPASPRLLLISLLHPMEWIGLETHLALLAALLDAREAEPDGDRPAALPAIGSIPIANPDGFARVEAALRDARRQWTRGNPAGVDLNRNFPVGHRARSSLGRHWPIYRPGPSPLSEPETAGLAAFARSFQPTVAISLHSLGRWIFVPPARRRHASASTTALLRRARDAASLCRYRAAMLGRWSPLFRAGGTELDFLHEELGASSYLVELSGGGFGRWGAQELLSPFHLFNPPRPEREIARVLPSLRRLIAAERRDGRNYGRTPGATVPAPPSGWNSKT